MRAAAAASRSRRDARRASRITVETGEEGARWPRDDRLSRDDREMLRAGDTVRLTSAAAGMAAGSLGVLIGWYAREPLEVVVNFYDGGPARVLEEHVERVATTQSTRRDGGVNRTVM